MTVKCKLGEIRQWLSGYEIWIMWRTPGKLRDQSLGKNAIRDVKKKKAQKQTKHQYLGAFGQGFGRSK